MIYKRHKIHADTRGCLVPINFSELPFVPLRVFNVDSVPPGTTRGGHAHHKTEQIIVCTKGVIEVILHNGQTEETTTLLKGDSILVPKMVWDSQLFVTPEASIMVLCSTEYDPEDYIHDFEEFQNLTA